MTQSKILLLTLTISAIVIQPLPELAYAQISEFKITAADGATFDFFGFSVSISGDYAVVGAGFDDDNGTESGSAYVFKRSGTSWAQEVKLLPADGKASDRFGFSVSISGDYALVGAYFNGTESGSAYVFKRSGTSWTQEAKLLPPDNAAGDQFGISVSISGDYALVGAALNDDNGTDAGSAYVFKRTGTSWAQEAKLLAPEGVAAGDNFGRSVSISDEFAVVGAWRDNADAGSVYVFKRIGTSWAQEAILLPAEGAVGDEFGFSVSIFGDYAVVGARLDDDVNGTDAGSAYVFKRTGTSWAQETILLPIDGAAGDNFGRSVSISGDFAVVGANGDDENGFDTGSAYVYKRTGTSWAQDRKLLPADGAIGDNFGISVSISGSYSIVGAYLDDDNESASGSAYLFTGFATPIGVDQAKIGLPEEFSLSQNYPNPFNPTTTIEYSLPKAGDVSLKVYNLTGQEVALLINDKMPAGNHTVSWDASGSASGVYFYRLQAGDFVKTRKMVLLK